MAAEVFVSYASEDDKDALKICRALDARGIKYWFAPAKVRTGEIFSDKIASELPLSSIFLLLWSKHSAKSAHVKREIAIAADAKLLLFPVRLDDHPIDGTYYLADVNWVRLDDVGAAGIARSVGQCLRVIDLPYPFRRLYNDTLNAELDFELHLESARLLVRFVTLVQIARYARSKQHSEDLNRHIEKTLALESLFADLDVAREVANWLDEHGNAVHEGFRDFFKATGGNLPGLNEVEESDDAAEFDGKHLHLLCETRDLLHPESTISREKAKRSLCHAIRDFLTKALAGEWVRAGRLAVLFDGARGDNRKFLEGPIELTGQQAAGARLSWDGSSEPFDLEPFFTLVKSKSGQWEVALLHSQNGAAAYSLLTAEKPLIEHRPAITLPWGRLEIVRKLPKLVYAGELHIAELHFTNHSGAALRIPEFEERLPDNLLSPDGLTSVRVTGEFHLDARESRVLEYPVRGGDVPGTTRSFPRHSVPYFFKDQESASAVEGDHEVIVRTLPAAQLIVTRHLENSRQEPIGTSVPLDTVVTVQVEIRSAGAVVENIRLEEEIEGGVLIDGNALLHSGPIDRLDRQKPIAGTYQIRVTGSGELSLRTRRSGMAEPIPIEGADLQIAIIDMPPPRVELRWGKVTRPGARELNAELRIDNTGGTSAMDLAIHVDVPGDVDVQGLITEWPAPHLDAGGTRAIPMIIVCAGIPSGSVHLTISYGSVRGGSFEARIDLDLSRVIETNIDALTVPGRSNTRTEITAALTDSDVVMFNLHGVRGSGKRRLLMSEIDRLSQTEGRRVSLYEVDCKMAHSFSEAIFMLLDRMVFADAPEEARGSDAAISEFLGRTGMDERQYKGHVAHLKALLYQTEPPHNGTWYALALLLTKLAKSRGLSRLILLLNNVSQFTEAEVEGLSTLRSYLQAPTPVRIALTSLSSIQIEAVDRRIEIGPLAVDDCKELIGRVFLMPKASEALEHALIEKSERLPANLVSLLERLVEKAGSLIDFDSPAGARIKDAAGFQRLPTSLLESERRAAQVSGIPEPVLACLAAFHEPISEDRVLLVLQRMEEELPADVLRKAWAECQRRRWLQSSGKKHEIASATVRQALREAAPTALVERVNQELFTLYQGENRPPRECFTHLVEAPAAFLARRGPQLVNGLRTLVASGSFTQVRAILNRLRNTNIDIDTTATLELALIEQELQWAATGDLDQQRVEAIHEQVTKAAKGQQRRTLSARLCLLLSQWYSRRAGEHARAAAVAESAESFWGPFRRLRINDPSLEFEFYLNLWSIYYRLLDEDRFRRVDAWIWKRLGAKRGGQYDSYAIATFLGLFLEFQREFPTPAARIDHFPLVWIEVFGKQRPLRDNMLEVLTRTERVRGSFLDEFLTNPDKLNQNNALVLGRLYLDLGSALWAQSPTKRRSDSRQPAEAGKDDTAAESYLQRAESLFAEGGFRLDLAQARSALGDMYLDQLHAAEKSGHKSRVRELCTVAARWLQLAAADFDAIDAEKHAADTWEAYAEVERKWLSYQPDRLAHAIRAYERLLELPPSPHPAQNRDAHRLTLVQLYQQAGRLDAASRILGQMAIQTAEVVQLRAMIHATMLALGSASIDLRNVADFELDLESLRGSPPITSAPAGSIPGQIATSSEAIGVIAWHLVGFYTNQQEGQPALYLLRSARTEIIAAHALTAQVGERLPRLLAGLWQMQGPSDDVMIQDFSSMVLPFITPATRGGVEQMLESVWDWEAKRQEQLHLAAPDMNLVLCEWSLGSGGEGVDERPLAGRIFRRLLSLDAWGNRSVARLVARALAVMVRSGAARRDSSAVQELSTLIDNLKDARHYSPALQVMVNLVEMLLDVHMSTKNAWYYGIIKQLAPQLRSLQELSENDFDEITQLIRVYVQLPTGLTDAVDLMQQQCQRLLNRKDYELLPRYLTFLSDLLDSVLRQDALVAQADPSSANQATLEESGRSRTLRAVAADLCGRIIADVRKQSISRRSARSVLYNAAKLLEARDASDVQAAVYAKLYDLAGQRDGSCVWGVYSAWVGSDSSRAALSIEDWIAITTYANSEDEEIGGRPVGNQRNYLITARTRNMHLGVLLQAQEWNSSLFVVYAGLEVQRLLSLQRFIASIDRFLQGSDELERMTWVTFLYDYLFATPEGAPFWEKLQKIKDKNQETVRLLDQLAQLLERQGVIDLKRPFDEIERKLSFSVQNFLVANRKRGQAIMNELSDRMRLFTLEDVLGEVQRRLAGQEASIDFGSVLGLWDESRGPDTAQGAAAAAIEPFLDRDPVRAIGPLTLSASRLLNQDEPALAERVYRCALTLCDAQGGDESAEILPVLRGLILSLRHQNKLAAACELATRRVNVMEARSDSDLGTALAELAELLQQNHRAADAQPYIARKLELERKGSGASIPVER